MHSRRSKVMRACVMTHITTRASVKFITEIARERKKKAGVRECTPAFC